MMLTRHQRQEVRKCRVAKSIRGTQECPRLCARVSLRHVYAQLIDDERGRVLLAVSTLSEELRSGWAKKAAGSAKAAASVGALLGEKALAQGIATAVFDRGARKYHGVVKALAESARKAGLKF